MSNTKFTLFISIYLIILNMCGRAADLVRQLSGHNADLMSATQIDVK